MSHTGDERLRHAWYETCAAHNKRLDEERQAKGPRGPLHGVPILIKDNIDTHDRMTTTVGSLALRGSIPPPAAVAGYPKITVPADHVAGDRRKAHSDL
jgi:Asp-tRNA(Asn)/Glu-tRNA(Gln) amidotransferase A subunit family amidase